MVKKHWLETIKQVPYIYIIYTPVWWWLKVKPTRNGYSIALYLIRVSYFYLSRFICLSVPSEWKVEVRAFEIHSRGTDWVPNRLFYTLLIDIVEEKWSKTYNISTLHGNLTEGSLLSKGCNLFNLWRHESMDNVMLYFLNYVVLGRHIESIMRTSANSGIIKRELQPKWAYSSVVKTLQI